MPRIFLSGADSVFRGAEFFHQGRKNFSGPPKSTNDPFIAVLLLFYDLNYINSTKYWFYNQKSGMVYKVTGQDINAQLVKISEIVNLKQLDFLKAFDRFFIQSSSQKY